MIVADRDTRRRDRMPRGRGSLSALAALLFAVPACGDGTATPAPTPDNPYVITISATGVVTPRELTVPPGTRVLFVNSHTRRHDMASDPHPDHQDCPELNQVGLLTPGQRRESGNLVDVRTCGFHDHDEPNNTNLRGRIHVRP